MSVALPPDPAILRQRAENLAYGLGCALWLHPDGRIRIDGPGERIDPGPGAAPTAHGHGLFATVKPQP